MGEMGEEVGADMGALARVPTGTRIVLSVPSFDSGGHVRHFPTLKDAVKRYAPAFDRRQEFEAVVVPSANPERWWYVIAGARA